jgi:hypothetical protein
MPNLLAEAVAQGKTLWLRKLLEQILPNLPTDIDGCHSWFDSLIKAFEAREPQPLITPSQQKNPLTQVRNAIKILDPNHLALDVVKFDEDTWNKINNAATDRIASRNTKLIASPDLIVEKAQQLLSSSQWSEIAAGLAVVTGRRSTEVIKTAKFTYKTQYSVTFSGSLKRRGELVECVFEIPTLCPAKLVINAIALLRKFLGEEVAELSNNQISGRYSRAVSKKCDEHFANLVPRREGEDNLYTHLFRAVYGTIACHWYCPHTVPEMEYRAAIQGHYQILDQQNPELRRSLAAGRHYFDYKISDGSGNIDGRLGIKLGQPGVKVIEQFARSPILKTSNNQDNHKTDKKAFMNETVTIPRYLLPRLNLLAEKLDLNEKDALEALFDWAEVSLSLAEVLEIDELKPNVLYEQVEELTLQAEQAQSSNQHHVAENSNDRENNHLPFDAESIRDLCQSVRVLSAEVAEQRKALLLPRPVSERVHAQAAPRPLREQPARGRSSFESQGTSDQKQSTTVKTDRKKSRTTVEAEILINHAIDQIMQYNEQEGIAHKDKLRIGIGAIRDLTQKGQKLINMSLANRKEEIDKHHDQHQLTNVYHNNRGKNAPSVHELVFLDKDVLKEKLAGI